MPGQVELLGEEELMPGRKWLVYKNHKTGQLTKVPKELMENPNTGRLMQFHLNGTENTRQASIQQSMDPESEWRVQGSLLDQNKLPKGHDFVSTGVPGAGAQVPQTPLEVVRSLRERLSPQRPVQVQQTSLPYSTDPKTRLYELAEEESALYETPGSHRAERDKLSEQKRRLHQILNSSLMSK